MSCDNHSTVSPSSRSRFHQEGRLDLGVSSCCRNRSTSVWHVDSCRLPWRLPTHARHHAVWMHENQRVMWPPLPQSSAGLVALEGHWYGLLQLPLMLIKCKCWFSVMRWSYCRASVKHFMIAVLIMLVVCVYVCVYLLTVWVWAGLLCRGESELSIL